MLNCCAAGEHVPEIERYIRTLKDCTRSAYNVLPFKNLPRVLLVHLLKNCTLWLNAFPATDGVSSIHSPRFLLTGRELSFDKHAVLEFGSYVEMHEEHSNGMEPRTMGAICLGPTGNAQGGHWFFSLTSGSRIVRHHWTALPMPQEVILCITQIGCTQGMPSRITYANRQGDEISDRLEDFVDDEGDGDSSSESDDETYMESGSDQDSEDDGTIISNGETASSEDDDDVDSQGDDDDDSQGNPDAAISSDVDDDKNPQDDSDPPGHGMDDPVVPDPGISWDPAGPDDDGDEEHSDVSGGVNPDTQVIDVSGGSTDEDEKWEGECGNDGSSNYGCEDEDECESDASSNAASSEVPPTESEQFEAAIGKNIGQQYCWCSLM